MRKSVANPDGDSNRHCDTNCHSYGYIFTYANGNCETDAHTETSAYTKASSDPSASAVMLAG